MSTVIVLKEWNPGVAASHSRLRTDSHCTHFVHDVNCPDLVGVDLSSAVTLEVRGRQENGTRDLINQLGVSPGLVRIFYCANELFKHASRHREFKRQVKIAMDKTPSRGAVMSHKNCSHESSMPARKLCREQGIGRG